MIRLFFIALLMGGLAIPSQAQKGKFKLNISVKGDSSDTEEKSENRGFMGKVFNTIRTVKEVIGDPSKLVISLEDKKTNNKESLKDYLRRRTPLKSKESYLPHELDSAETLLAYRRRIESFSTSV
jgi:hypothetical protein